MIRHFSAAIGTVLIAVATGWAALELPRVTINLDTGWLYKAADNAAYSSSTADESSFSKVCVPHANVVTKHAYQSESAFRIVSWYRRHITAPESWNGRRLLLEFQAVSINAVVYVNGTKVGEHRGGYTPFTLDITDKITSGKDNIFAVQVDSKSQPGVPPEGGSMDYMVYGGIVRHVNLIVTGQQYIDGVFAFTPNPVKTAPSSPVVTIKIAVVNRAAAAKSCRVVSEILEAGRGVVATASGTIDLPANGSAEATLTTEALASPQLWDVDHPNLYTVNTRLVDGETTVDAHVARTGFRSLTVDKTDGKCYLNGVPIKLRGLNRHETFPYIGRAAARRLQRKDADILKYELGCNIVRTSHYPQSPDFLDRCDEIGLLVLEEVPGWSYIGNDAWKKLEMQNLKDMVIRDRNHPCILTWGVRINESPDDNAFYKTMNDTAHFYDPTRFTCGVRRSNSDPATSFLEDIWTQNFVTPNTNPDNMPTITTEWCGHNLDPQAHSWDDDNIQLVQITDSKYGHAKGHHDSYKTSIWGGLLGWCAFDYASSHAMATTNETGRGKGSYVCPHGVSSIFRLPKLAAWFYQSQRDPKLYGPMVHICNFWTSGSPSTVLVVSNCEQVELFQDGKSLGKKAAGNLYTSLPHPPFSWTATYKAGELRAVGYMGATEAATHTVKTPGSPAAITVVPDTTTLFEGGDMTRIVVSLVDSNGQVLNARADSVSLSAEGAGDFIGEAKTALEGGQMAFFVKTRSSGTGTITCRASAGEINGSASINVVSVTPVATLLPAASPFSSGRTAQMSRFTIFDRNTAALSRLPGDAAIRIYDLRGKVLFSGTVADGMRHAPASKMAGGIRIVELVRHTRPRPSTGQ